MLLSWKPYEVSLMLLFLLIVRFTTGLVPHGGDYIIIFKTFQWDIPNSVDTAVTFVTDTIVSATQFVPSCIPRLSRPTHGGIVIVSQHGKGK